ncbi:MAG: hypothetical protein KF766_17260 [Rhodocyclaceae bacterium]|nr:hypothetical protein [Rhodocyclaceae bacterium]
MDAWYRGRLVFTLLALGLLTVTAEGLAEDRPGFYSPRFVSNGQISFNYCIEHNRPQTCNALMYDIALDRFLAYQDSAGNRIIDVAVSHSGRLAAFIVQEAGFLFSRTQNCIGVLDIESRRYRRAACSEEARRYPEFISEDRIVYFAEETTETKTGRTLRERKLFVMDLADMAEKQAVATSFYAPSSPRSLGDGQHVAISDFGYVSRENLRTKKTRSKEDPVTDLLRISVTDGKIELINPEGIELIGPKVSLKSGRVYALQRWSSAAAKGFVHDVQVIGPGGAQRITHFEQFIWGMDVSPDERFLALSVAAPDRKVMNGQLLLYEIETKQFRKLEIRNRDDVRITGE